MRTVNLEAWLDALRVLRAPEAVFPREALGAIERLGKVPCAGAEDTGSLFRRWIVLGAMRRRASGGRQARLLLDLGLCTVDDLVRCLRARRDEPPREQSAFALDLEDTIFAVIERAPLPELAALSDLFDTQSGPAFNALHAAVAERSAAAGELPGCLAALARIGWHGGLLRALGAVWPWLSREARETWAERAWSRVCSSDLPRVYLIEPLFAIAVLTMNPSYLRRAEQAVATLSNEELACSPDFSHPREDLASALIAFGRWDEALATVFALAPPDRWTALCRIIPKADSPARRAELVSEALGLSDASNLWCLLEVAPEAAVEVFDRAMAELGEGQRFEALCDLAHHLPEPQRAVACGHITRDFLRSPPSLSDRAGVEAWGALLATLSRAGHEELISHAQRVFLCEGLLADPTIELWTEFISYVPEALLGAVLDAALGRLAGAEHYLSRDEAMKLGLGLLHRVSRPAREAWLRAALPFAPRVCWDRLDHGALDAWSPDPRRWILSERLRIHQQNHLDPMELGRTLASIKTFVARARSGELLCVVADDPAERASLQGSLSEMLRDGAKLDDDALAWALSFTARLWGLAAIEGPLLGAVTSLSQAARGARRG